MYDIQLEINRIGSIVYKDGQSISPLLYKI